MSLYTHGKVGEHQDPKVAFNFGPTFVFPVSSFGDAPAPRPMMKLPASHWRDFAPGGALFAILRRCLQHKHENHLRRFDWQSDKKRAEFVGVMRACAEDLHRRGMRRVARVALAEGEFSSPEAVRRVREAARATGAVLAASPSDEGVTHVLHAAPRAASDGGAEPEGAEPKGSDRGDEVDGDEAFRAGRENACVILGVTTGGKEALVRYVRHPESYEQTVSLAAALGSARAAPGAAAEPPSAPPPERDDDPDRDHLCLGSWWGARGGAPAHVFAKWLTDSAAFNEWCEEEDYLWEDPAQAATRAAREATRAREAEARVHAAARGHASAAGQRPCERARLLEFLGGSLRGREEHDAFLVVFGQHVRDDAPHRCEEARDVDDQYFLHHRREEAGARLLHRRHVLANDAPRTPESGPVPGKGELAELARGAWKCGRGSLTPRARRTRRGTTCHGSWTSAYASGARAR